MAGRRGGERVRGLSAPDASLTMVVDGCREVRIHDESFRGQRFPDKHRDFVGKKDMWWVIAVPYISEGRERRKGMREEGKTGEQKE